MKNLLKTRKIWFIALALSAAIVGTIISVLVLAGRGEVDVGPWTLDLVITPYADVVRFEAQGAATLQVRIFDLSGKEVWDSGVISGGIVDWDRTNEWGERLAYGAYLYHAQSWSADGALVFQKRGKLALLPGDKVQLQVAPPVSSPSGHEDAPLSWTTPLTLKPMAVDVDHSSESWAFGQLGIGTTSPGQLLNIAGSTNPMLLVDATSGTPDTGNAFLTFVNDAGRAGIFVMGRSGLPTPKCNAMTFRNDYSEGNLIFQTAGSVDRLVIKYDGNIGIGTASPSATLEVHGSATNLLALYDPVAPSDPKFRVTKTGEVRADGSYYGASFNTGSADVAERINVSEWVEEGNVVEIDPEHPGFFRKASCPYSTKVVGIISTSPGVILGNTFNASAEKWEDNRPMLALAGRVPVKVTTENGPIQIGDLLVSSSTPGHAMRSPDREACIGAVIGKAMEALGEGTGVIMVQVMLW